MPHFMATVHPFPRVPQIDYCDRKEDSFILDQDTDNDWSACNFQAMSLRTAASDSMDLMPELAPYRHAGVQRCMKTPERRCSIEAPLSWQADCYEKSNPLRYGLDLPHHGSSGNQWTRIDQDSSCSGGSTLSPRTSDSRSEADGYLSHPVSQNREIPGLGSDYTPLGGQWCLPEEVPYPGPGCATVIPHELQQYPDPEGCLEDVNQRPGMHAITVSEPYSPEDVEHYASFERSDRFSPEDEPLGSIIKDYSTAPSIQDDNDSNMGDSPEADDDDDYNPRADRRTHGRMSHRSMTLKNPILTPKRPQRIKSATSQAVKPTKIAKKTPKSFTASSPPANRNPDLLPCPHCTAGLSSESALKKHVLALHTRPFICTFQRYGCSSTVGSKNEWKRHINVQHMHLETWRCDIGACALQSGRPKEHKHPSPIPSGQTKPHESPYHEFDRKDLFTQHLKRMHAPPHSASRAEKNKFDNSIEEIQKRCHTRLREAPTNSICPYCPAHPAFETWDDRVEHVGKHLERSDFDKNTEIEDEALRDWLSQEGYLIWKGPAQKWKLVDTGKKRKSRGETSVREEGEEDAEGDEEE